MSVFIRAVSKADTKTIGEIKALSESAFSRFGSYGELIGSLITESATIAGALHVDGRFAGYVLLAFSLVQEHDRDRHGPLYRRIGVPSNSLREEIWAVALKPQYRGKHLGDHLMRWAIDMAEVSGVSVVHLTVAHDNTRAIKLFERHGFMFETCVDAGTYATGVEARYMYRTIGE